MAAFELGSIDDLLPQKLDFLVNGLLDTGQPISHRFRALFSLRNLKGRRPREALVQAMNDSSSNLLAHEAAFALGQMQDEDAIPCLRAVLEDHARYHPIVRHEAAEALGAIGKTECLDLLKKALVLDPALEVRETCELALQRIEQGIRVMKSSGAAEEVDASPFLSVDPVAPAPSSTGTASLRQILLDDQAPMYRRYSALFALRNRGGSEAVEAIVAALGCESALLKHEVAYVLGQLQEKCTIDALILTLENGLEHPMVRHEAAEALGSIADDRSLTFLKKYLADPEPIVHQSCEVALTMLEFEQQGKAFEYFYQEDPMLK
ncbi:hypothetical protein O6H91_04G146400 [Diphasiastrum complanatum]|uniref:Uncharacterized protein n=1 Tax=Diphasiastrum complanatum TaxID=34168 RepID=A0ACC2E360_DIPCM|nr:hypothetical protein O6H91_Y253700 [Diphasiastrum complanatum]KAJ7560795.1 hypothetical protein O6H91_04G146400 [Diphasiastrum complanatum]